jgi:hypothetical protein
MQKEDIYVFCHSTKNAIKANREFITATEYSPIFFNRNERLRSRWDTPTADLLQKLRASPCLERGSEPGFSHRQHLFNFFTKKNQKKIGNVLSELYANFEAADGVELTIICG